MRPRVARAILRIVAAAGIPGIIAGSIAGNDGAAITFGAITAAAAVGLILVTAVTTEPATPDELGADVEARIADLVAAGADSSSVRELVARAVQLGQQQHNS